MRVSIHPDPHRPLSVGLSAGEAPAGGQGVVGEGTAERDNEYSQEMTYTWEGTGLGSVCEVSRRRLPHCSETCACCVEESLRPHG
jgi:hypothetical protein